MSISIDTYCLQCLLRRNIALAQSCERRRGRQRGQPCFWLDRIGAGKRQRDIGWQVPRPLAQRRQQQLDGRFGHSGFVADRGDLELVGAARRFERDFIALVLADQCAGDRR